MRILGLLGDAVVGRNGRQPYCAGRRLNGAIRFAIAPYLVCVVLASFGPSASAQERLELTDAWIRLAPPSAHHHAGYLTLVNGGKDARQLVGAASPDYAKVELHASRVSGGIATMEPVAQVEIAAGQSVKFAPGGLHLMLIGPKAPQKEGASVAFTLSFADGSTLAGKATVKRDGGGGHKHGAHHGH